MGKDVILEVPLGTIAIDEETGIKEAEVLHDGEEIIWLPGGKGGLGNTNFKTPTNQAPEHAQPGLPGIEGWKIVELKVLADVGLVGFPYLGRLARRIERVRRGGSWGMKIPETSCHRGPSRRIRSTV